VKVLFCFTFLLTTQTLRKDIMSMSPEARRFEKLLRHAKAYGAVIREGHEMDLFVAHSISREEANYFRNEYYSVFPKPKLDNLRRTKDMPDGEGRTRVIFECDESLKQRLDKLPHGSRVVLFNGMTKLMLDSVIKKDGSP